MSVAQLLFRQGNFIGEIELDVVIREGATSTVQLTENPVENGANMNDHIIIEPMTFFVDGVVSDISSTIIGQLTQTPTILTGENTKSREAWNDLLELQRNRIPFTLVQGLKSYSNIIITSINESQDKDTSNALFFSATMKEVIFAGQPAPTADIFNESDVADKALPTVIGGLKNLLGI
jgi:hypothetical protein